MRPILLVDPISRPVRTRISLIATISYEIAKMTNVGLRPVESTVSIG